MRLVEPGMEFVNNDGKKLVVLSQVRKNVWLVLFPETGTKREAGDSAIKNGRVKDHYSKTVMGIGALGETRRPFKPALRMMWDNMLHRCYDHSRHNYKSYGGKGVVVSDRWLIYSNFVDDVEAMPNYTYEKIKNGELVLDKDTNGGRVYSRDNCVLLTKAENSKLIERVRKHVDIYVDDELIMKDVSVRAASALLGVSYDVVEDRLKTGENKALRKTKASRQSSVKGKIMVVNSVVEGVTTKFD